MDSLIAAADAFPTIVSLLCNFKQERSGRELTAFMAWLKEKHHDDVAAAIERDAALSTELSGMLSANHTDLIERLSQLASQNEQLASQFAGFESLASALNPTVKLSEQAISVLKQLVESGAERLIECTMFTNEPDVYALSGGGQIEYSDRRFIKDDLGALVSAGLLRLEIASAEEPGTFLSLGWRQSFSSDAAEGKG